MRLRSDGLGRVRRTRSFSAVFAEDNVVTRQSGSFASTMWGSNGIFRLSPNGIALERGPDGPAKVAMATLQFYQALRISEAAALDWDDVHLDRQNRGWSQVVACRDVAK